MKLTNYKKQDDVITFTLSGVDGKLVNTLRRLIISGVPTMAVEKVTFYANRSVLNDEVLAHRLGLVPLKTDLKTYTLPGECTCKGSGCAKCMATLSLDVAGPKTVYSGDMTSTDPTIVPIFDNIPLVKLGEKQKLKFEATAQLGTGRDHIKWQAGLASYENTEKDIYEFMLESYGQLSPEELLSSAFEVFEEKLKRLKKELG